MTYVSNRISTGLIASFMLVALAALNAAPASAQITPVGITLTPLPTSTSTVTPTSVPATPTATPVPVTPTTTLTPTSTPTVAIFVTSGTSGSFIGGTVYVDENVDQIFNSKEKSKKDVTVTLLFSSGGSSNAKIKQKTDDNGYFEFKSLASGVYVVTVEVPDGYVSTTAEQYQVSVNGLDGTRLANFGLLKVTDSNSTATPYSSNSGNTSSRSGLVNSSGSSGSSGSSSSTVNGTFTPSPTATSTPTFTPIQKLNLLPPIRSARFFMEGHADDNGLLYDYAAEGSVLQQGDIDMDLTINGHPVDVVTLGSQAYMHPTDAETWSTASATALRNWYGVLSPLDVLNLWNMDTVVLDVRPTSLIERIDSEDVRRVDVLLVSKVPTPSTVSSISLAAGVTSTPMPAGIGALYPSLSIQPQLRNDPNGATIVAQVPGSTSPSSPTSLQLIDGVVELWVSTSDSYVKAAHLKLNVPSTRQDRPGRLEPAVVDAWVWYSNHNEPFTISAPTQLMPPTPQPALATAIAMATEQAGRSTNGSVSVAPIPAPVRGGSDPGPSVGGGVVQPQATVPVQATGVVGTPDSRVAASERALLALASASGPRTASKVTNTGVVLDVPWRGVTDGAGTTIATDGPTALGMILESFGVTAPTADLQALADRWQTVATDGDSVSIETLVRMAERGSLRPIGTGRGPGGGDWSSIMARDFLRRGYPVLALVRPQIITGGAVDPDQPDRFIVLVGYDGDDILYHDPSGLEGESRRIDSVTLDQAWMQATPPRQGVVFGFGASVVGLLDGPGRSAQLNPQVTATPTSASIRITPTVMVLPTPETAEPVETSSGPPPALLGFLGILAGGVGFLIARLYR